MTGQYETDGDTWGICPRRVFLHIAPHAVRHMIGGYAKIPKTISVRIDIATKPNTAMDENL
jgi:hypothetical protein